MAAAVAALVVDEGVHVQPVLDRQAVRVQRVAHRGRVAGVAAQDEPVSMPAAASASSARATAASLRSMPTMRSGRSSRWRPRSVRLADELVDVHEPAAVVAAGEHDEARLVGERLAVEDARDDRVGVGEVAPVRDRARAQVHLVLDVPLADAVVAGRVRGGQLAAVEVGQPGEHRQVGADEAEVGDEVQAVAAGLGPGAGVVDPAERVQQAAGLLAAVAGRQRRGRRRRRAVRPPVASSQSRTGEASAPSSWAATWSRSAGLEVVELPARGGRVDELGEAARALALPGLASRRRARCR